MPSRRGPVRFARKPSRGCATTVFLFDRSIEFGLAEPQKTENRSLTTADGVRGVRSRHPIGLWNPLDERRWYIRHLQRPVLPLQALVMPTASYECLGCQQSAALGQPQHDTSADKGAIRFRCHCSQSLTYVMKFSSEPLVRSLCPPTMLCWWLGHRALHQINKDNPVLDGQVSTRCIGSEARHSKHANQVARQRQVFALHHLTAVDFVRGEC